MYNPSIARFLSVDPLAPSFPWNSVYAFAEGDVIQSIDLDGLEKAKTTKKEGKQTDPKLDPSNFLLQETRSEQKNWISHQPAEVIVIPEFKSEREKFEFYANLYPTNYKPDQLNRGKLSKQHSVQAEMFVNNLKIAVPGLDAGLKVYNGQTLDNWDIAFLIIDAAPLAGKALKGLTKGARFLMINGKKTAIADDLAEAIIKCACFTEGTLVMTDSGYIEIQNLQIGDLVWAFDEETQVLELKEVTNTFIIHESEKIYYLHIKDEIIEVTGKHPFYIDGKWIEVQYLNVGDSVQLYSGEKSAIDSIRIEEGEYTVYNFSVDDFSTYYVSETGILVHNCKGFESFGHFKQFGTQLQAGLAKKGYKNTKLFMQGSSAKGVSHKGVPFGSHSDFDVALAGDDIFTKASELGLTNHISSGPIEAGSEAAKLLGISDLLTRMSEKFGRAVNVKIYKNAQEAKLKDVSVRIPTANGG